MQNESSECSDYETVPRTFPLLEKAKIKALVIPVHPIKKETFDHYVNLLRKFAVVSMADLTPPDPARGVSEFNNQHFTDGCLYFDFITRYNREHQSLESIHVNRQPLGAIGIMHCGQCVDARAAHKRFIAATQNFPTVMVTRCFGFDPSETTPDNTKGLIMIPNVGQLGFYISTMISDFASELLTAFGGLAKAIETKTMISLPMITASVPHQSSMLWHNSSSQSVTLPQPVLSTASSQRAIVPLDAVSASGAASGGAALIAQPAAMQASSNLSDQLEMRIKRRTPARIQKLHGDLFLLSGRSEEAMRLYTLCLDTMRSNSDYLWQAATLENLAAAQLMQLMALAQVVAVSVQSKTYFPTQFLVPPSAAQLLQTQHGPLRAFLAELPEKYREIVHLLLKSAQAPVQNPYPLLLMDTQFCLVDMLTHMLECGFTEPLLNGGGCNAWEALRSTSSTMVEAVSSTLGGGTAISSALSNAAYSGNLSTSKVSKADVSSWLMHCWASGVELLSFSDQLWLLVRLSSAYKRIEYTRKSAFFAFQLSLLVQTLADSGQLSKKLKAAYRQFLPLLDDVIKLFGLSEYDKLPPGPLGDWVVASYPSQFQINGWEELQVDILEQCRALCDSLEDDSRLLGYSALLLRRMHSQLPLERQLEVQKRLKKAGFSLLESTKAVSSVDASKLSTYRVGLLMLRSMVPAEQPGALQLYAKPGTLKSPSTSQDPFIYNPHAQKELLLPGTAAKYAAKEPLHVVCEFANPFKFDLDIQAIELVATQATVPIVTQPVSVVVPAQTDKMFVVLRCLPQSAGILKIEGCRVRMLGGTVSEFVPPLPRQSADIKLGTTWDEAGLVVEIVPEQPQLQMSNSLDEGQDALFLFEGERCRVDFSLKNIGNERVKFCQIEISEKYAKHSDRTASEQPSAIEIYDRDVHDHLLRACWLSNGQDDAQLFHKPPKAHQLNADSLGPQGSQQLGLEVYGKRGLTAIELKIEYAATSDESDFFVRKCAQTILVTVEQALRISHFDILLHNDASKPTSSVSLNEQQLVMVEAPPCTPKSDSCGSALCLLTFDLTNSSFLDFKVTFTTVNFADVGSRLTKESVIGAGRTKQVMIIMPRLFLAPEQLSQTIPSPEHLQFVLGKVRKLDKVAEMLERKFFWYRELLVGGIKFSGVIQINWASVCERGIRQSHGRMPLRSLKLQKRMLGIVAVDLLQIVPQCDPDCVIGQPFNVRWKIMSVDGVSSSLIFRVVVAQDLQNGSFVTDLEEKQLLSVGKPLQTVLPSLAPNSFVEYSIPVCFHTVGTFHFIYHVEVNNRLPVSAYSFSSSQRQDALYWAPEPFIISIKNV